MKTNVQILREKNPKVASIYNVLIENRSYQKLRISCVIKFLIPSCHELFRNWYLPFTQNPQKIAPQMLVTHYQIVNFAKINSNVVRKTWTIVNYYLQQPLRTLKTNWCQYQSSTTGQTTYFTIATINVLLEIIFSKLQRNIDLKQTEFTTIDLPNIQEKGQTFIYRMAHCCPSQLYWWLSYTTTNH